MLKVYPKTCYRRPLDARESTYSPGHIQRYGFGISSRCRVGIVGPTRDSSAGKCSCWIWGMAKNAHMRKTRPYRTPGPCPFPSPPLVLNGGGRIAIANYLSSRKGHNHLYGGWYGPPRRLLWPGFRIFSKKRTEDFEIKKSCGLPAIALNHKVVWVT